MPEPSAFAPICPAVNTKPLATIACEYGAPPNGPAAWSVEITVF